MADTFLLEIVTPERVFMQDQAVSYTHLDVYKRQAVCVVAYGFQSCLSLALVHRQNAGLCGGISVDGAMVRGPSGRLCGCSAISVVRRGCRHIHQGKEELTCLLYTSIVQFCFLGFQLRLFGIQILLGLGDALIIGIQLFLAGVHFLLFGFCRSGIVLRNRLRCV